MRESKLYNHHNYYDYYIFAVIPAPIVYFKVVAVKTLVVYLRIIIKYSVIFRDFFSSLIKMGKIIFFKEIWSIALGSKLFEFSFKRIQRW